MFAKIAYKQNINMWKTNFSLQHLKLIMGTKLFFRPKTIFANNVIFSIILEFRNLKFPELENWELEVPGTWELRHFGTCLRVSPIYTWYIADREVEL